MNIVRYKSEIILENFEQLEVEIIPAQNSVWLYFNSKPRSCYTVTLLKELDKFQSILRNNKGKLFHNNQLIKIDYCVITSRHPVFSYGGDLDYFISCVENNNREALREYAQLCVDAVFYSYIGREFDITTISLVNGSALGGGFEAALSSQIIIAEKDSQMGLPETLFNLFPGMGAYQLLSRRVNTSLTEKIMLSGKLYCADELFDMGIVDQVVENKKGVIAVDNLINTYKNRTNSLKCVKKVRQLVNPLKHQELIDVADIWVDSVFKISKRDIRIMSKLISSQRKSSACHSNKQTA